jgi:rhodanese-related sulfurtransferase
MRPVRLSPGRGIATDPTLSPGAGLAYPAWSHAELSGRGGQGEARDHRAHARGGGGPVGHRSRADRRSRARRVRAGRDRGARPIPRGVLESTIRGQVPDPGREIVVYCAVGARSALAAKALGEMGYTDVASMAGGFERWKAEGRSWRVPGHPDRRPESPLQPSHPVAGSGRGRSGQAARLEGAAGRSRRARISGCALSRRRRRRHHRHRRLRRGRRLQPATPDPPHRRPDRPVRRSNRPRDHPGPQPGREDHPLSGAVVGIERARHHEGLRRGGGRRRQLPHPVSGQRCLAPPADSGGARRHLPLRGSGERVRPVRRPLLSVPLPPAPAPRAGARRVPRRVYWECCRASSARSRRWRRSSCCWASASRWWNRLLTYDALDQEFRRLRLRRDPSCRACSTRGCLR